MKLKPGYVPKELLTDDIVSKLYIEDKFFHELFNLMFDKWGWSVTEINSDSLKIYELVKKYYRGDYK